MGIGRRQFLLLFGAELTAIAARSQSVGAIHDNTYINRRLGIAFKKPSGWHFNEVRNLGQIAKGQLLDLDEHMLTALVDDAMQFLVVSVSQDPVQAHPERFTCGINVFLEPIGDEGDDVLANAHDESRILAKMLPEFRMTTPVHALSVSNCGAAEYIAEFRFAHESMAQDVLARKRSLLVVQEGWRHTFRMYDAPSLGPRRCFDYADFMHSISLV